MDRGTLASRARDALRGTPTGLATADLAARLFGNASVRLPALVSQVGELLARLRDRGEVVHLGDDLWIAADEAVVSRTDLPSASVDGHDVPDLTATVPAVSGERDFAVLAVLAAGMVRGIERILEVAVVRVTDGNPVLTWSTLVNPDPTSSGMVRLPRTVLERAGLEPDAFEDAMPVGAAMTEVASLLEGAVVVGHGVGATLDMLSRVARWHGVPTPYRRGMEWVDTEALARTVLPDLVRPSVDRVAQALGVPPVRRDRASLRAPQLAMIHRALQARVGGSQADLPTSGLPGGTQAPVMQAVGRLPDAPGVYTFLDGSGARLYIGKASSLRSRVSQHFSLLGSSARGDSLLARVATITHQVTETELDAVILEQASIAQWRPPYNVQTTTHAGPPYLVIDGGIYPRIRGTRSPLAHSIDPMQLAVGDEGSDAIVFGPYRTTSVARQVARVVTRVFGVRPCARILPARRALMRVPCLLHGQGICPAPCAPNISPEAYATMVGMAIRWLTDGREVTFDAIDMRLRTLGREFATADTEVLAGWEREWLLEVRRRLARVRTDERPVAGIARGADVYMACRLHWSVGRGFVVWHVRGGRVLHRRVWSPDSEIVFGTPDTDRLLASDPARDTMVMRWVQRHAGLPELLVLDPDTASDRSVLGTLLRNWLHRVDRETGPWASVGLGDGSDFEEIGGMTTSE